MERNLLIYLAIENPMLLKGFEGLILSQLNSNAQIIPIISPTELANLDFQNNLNSNEILIFDDDYKSEKNNVLLFNIIKENPHLKTLFLTKVIDYHHLKLLFNLGFTGVVNKDISPHEFIDLMVDVIKGKKSLAPKFQNMVIKHFCQKETNFQDPKISQMEEEEINHFEKLYGLTKREKEILCLICNGKNTKEISEDLFISLHTAETHRRNLLAKLDVKNTAQMVKVAVLHRLVEV
jgi:DNA-binding NarL/FixJ family response regulator